MTKFLLAVLGLLYLSPSVHGLCLNPCTRPSFCNDGDLTAIPGTCNQYYLCEFNQWQVQNCPEQTVFNMSGTADTDCSCVNVAEDITCPYNCAELTTEPTPPGPCPGVPDPCTEGAKYADRSDCTFYYRCTGGVLNRTQCGLGPFHGYCNVSGLPCAYDIQLQQCIHPDRSFDCENRCSTKNDVTNDELEANQAGVKSEAGDKKPVEKLKHTSIVDVIKAGGKKNEKIIKEKESNGVKNKKYQPEKETSNHVEDDNVMRREATCLDASRICDTPDYCAEAEYIAHPSNCSMYYECVYGFWYIRVCAEGAIFDNTQCLCVNPGEGTCYDECTDPTPSTTVAPGPCPGVSCTTDGDRVADPNNCEFYYLCRFGTWLHAECIGGVSDDCTLVGHSCAYDTATQRCIHPDSSFECDPRCP